MLGSDHCNDLRWSCSSRISPIRSESMRISAFRCLMLVLLGGVTLGAQCQSGGKTTISKSTLKGTSVLSGGSFPVYTTVAIPILAPDQDLPTARANSVTNPQASKQGGGALSIPAPQTNAVTEKGGVAAA